MQEEIWKEIVGFENYEVSNFGRIRRKATGKFLTYSVSNWGYCRVNAYNNGVKKHISVHRAVAQAFIPNNDPERIQVNHIDCDKTNNCVTNLEWVTPVENMAHAYANDLVPSANSRAVIATEMDFTVYAQFPSTRAASAALTGTEAHQGTISRSAHSWGKHTALGFRWFFIDDAFPYC